VRVAASVVFVPYDLVWDFDSVYRADGLAVGAVVAGVRAGDDGYLVLQRQRVRGTYLHAIAAAGTRFGINYR